MSPARIEALTDAQQAQMGPWAQSWIARGLSTEPVDRATFERGAARCYAYAGVPWPNRVVYVPSPLVLALAAPTATRLLGGAVRDAVDGAVRGAVRDAVGGAVRDAWYSYLGGCWWLGWQAYTSFFREVCRLDLPGDLWDRDHAYMQAQSAAGWWWPYRHFVMVSERPAYIHRERVGPDGWTSHRLHCPTGPAIGWEGWQLHYWHGLRVPAWVVESPSAEAIAAEANVEVRRAGIESLGWDRFIADAELALVGTEPDPGNPGQVLRLYDVPERLWGGRVRLLLATNGSVERDGTRRTYGLTVPAEIEAPVTAAAWTCGETREEYLATVART